MLNRCEFIGNLGKDPEVRTTQSGVKIVGLSVGVTRKWKSNGEQKEATEWVRANVWGNQQGDGLAGVAERFLEKGSKVYIAGRMETRKWQDQQGQDRYSTEINVQELELLSSRQDGGSQGGQHSEGGSSNYGGGRGGNGGGWNPPDDFDDSIPF